MLRLEQSPTRVEIRHDFETRVRRYGVPLPSDNRRAGIRDDLAQLVLPFQPLLSNDCVIASS